MISIILFCFTIAAAVSQENGTYLATNVFWTYLKGSDTYYFTSDMVADSTDSRIQFNLSSNAEGLFLITSAESTVGISDETGRLSLFPISDTRFTVKMIQYNPFKFQLFHQSESLVTRNTREPFQFYVQTKFPDEPVATFGLDGFAVFDVDEIYQGKRSNIVKVLTAIRNTPNINVHLAYEDFVDLMGHYKHIEGKEVFQVGLHIREDLGINATIFRKIPEQVQLVTSGEMISLTYQDNGYAMRNHISYATATATFPYTFEFHTDELRWAIRYNFHTYWYIEKKYARQELKYKEGFDAENTFELIYDVYNNQGRIGICSDVNNCLRQEEEECDTFSCSLQADLILEYYFIATRFQVNVDDMFSYDNMDQLAYIIHLYSEDTEKAYDELARKIRIWTYSFGKKVMIIAYYAVQDLGCVGNNILELDFFASAKLLLCDVPLTWLYERVTNYTMKYSIASDLHENVKPYRIKARSHMTVTGIPDRIDLAIIYADNYHLIMDGKDLVDRQIEDYQYEFEIVFQSEALDFKIYIVAIDEGYGRLSANTTTPDFVFGDYKKGDAEFYVKEYN